MCTVRFFRSLSCDFLLFPALFRRFILYRLSSISLHSLVPSCAEPLTNDFCPVSFSPFQNALFFLLSLIFCLSAFSPHSLPCNSLCPYSLFSSCSYKEIHYYKPTAAERDLTKSTTVSLLLLCSLLTESFFFYASICSLHPFTCFAARIYCR